MHMTDFAYDGKQILVPLSAAYPSSLVYIYISKGSFSFYSCTSAIVARL